jgi:hypothetical protein
MASFMGKLASFLHSGKLPDETKALLKTDGGVDYLAEGIEATVTLRNFKAPGIACAQRRLAFVGSFALSKRRLFIRAQGFHSIDVNLTFDDPTFATLVFEIHPGGLSVAFDAAKHIPHAKGQVEVHLPLSEASRVGNLLQEHGACVRNKN